MNQDEEPQYYVSNNGPVMDKLGLIDYYQTRITILNYYCNRIRETEDPKRIAYIQTMMDGMINQLHQGN